MPFPCPARSLRLAAPFLALGVGLACSPAAPLPPRGSPLLQATRLPNVENQPEPSSPLEAATPTKALIAVVPEGTHGPHLSPLRAMRRLPNGDDLPSARLAVWAAGGPERGRRWQMAMLSERGDLLREASEAGAAPQAIDLVHIAPRGDGFLVLCAAPTETGSVVHSLPVSADGDALGPMRVVAESPEPILWIGSAELESGAAALWASRSSRSAHVYAAKLADDATSPEGAYLVANDARAWQVASWQQKLIVTWVSSAPGKGRAVKVAWLGATGARAREVTLAQGASIGRHLEARVVGERFVVAWEQKNAADELYTVRVASLQQDGTLSRQPSPISPSLGAQRLHALVPPASLEEQAFLVWEELDQNPGGRRRLRIASIDEDAVLSQRRTEIAWAGGAARLPEFASQPGGLAVLTTAPACPSAEAECTGAAVPTFVQLDNQLRVVASEPIELRLDLPGPDELPAEAEAPEDPPPADEEAAVAPDTTATWDLACGSVACSALGAVARAPVPVAGLELRAHTNEFQTQAWELPALSPPFVERVSRIRKVEPLADLRSAIWDEHTLVASLTQFDPNTPYKRRTTPAPDGRFGPLRARLEVQSLSPAGEPMSEPAVISYRARSVSGIALARAAAERSFLLWSAIDEGQPQVFATLVHRDGKRLIQRVLTNTAGEVRAVSAATTPHGFLAAWVDDHNGKPSAWVTPLSAQLKRDSPSERLSPDAHVASDVRVASHGNHAWAAWVHGIAGKSEELSIAPLDLRTGKPQGKPLVIARGAFGELASADLQANAEGAYLAWVQRQPGSLHFAQVDLRGRLVGSTRVINQPGMQHQRLHCEPQRCFSVADMRSPGSRLALADWSANAPTLQPLLRRSALALDPAAFTLSPSGLVFASRSRTSAEVRWGHIRW